MGWCLFHILQGWELHLCTALLTVDREPAQPLGTKGLSGTPGASKVTLMLPLVSCYDKSTAPVRILGQRCLKGLHSPFPGLIGQERCSASAGKIPALSIFSHAWQVLSDQKFPARLCSSPRATQSCHLLMLDAQAPQWQQLQLAGHLPPLWPLPQEDTQPEEAPRLVLGSADRQQHEGQATFFVFSSRPRCTKEKSSGF